MPAFVGDTRTLRRRPGLPLAAAAAAPDLLDPPFAGSAGLLRGSESESESEKAYGPMTLPMSTPRPSGAWTAICQVARDTRRCHKGGGKERRGVHSIDPKAAWCATHCSLGLRGLLLRDLCWRLQDGVQQRRARVVGEASCELAAKQACNACVDW